MLKELKRMPEPLQKQILIRLALAALSLVLLIVIIIVTGDVYLWLPCAAAAIFFAFAAFLLFRRILLGEYVVIPGECAEVGVTPIRRRAKYMILQTEGCKLKVMLHSRRKKIPGGASVRLYAAKNTPIYDQDGIQVMYTYMAIVVE